MTLFKGCQLVGVVSYMTVLNVRLVILMLTNYRPFFCFVLKAIGVYGVRSNKTAKFH